MPTSYTALLGLALPVTGELSGTWGDVVSNYITQYVDSAVAGTQTISGSQTAVTLSVTNGSSLVTAGSGATGSAQFQIINCTGNPAGLLTITAPASSRQYIIINATSTSQSVKIVGTGPTTGVTILSGEKAHVAWNGSDFVKIATQSGNGSFVDLTVSGSMTLSGGTANGVLYLNGSKVATSGSALTFDGTNLGLSGTGSRFINLGSTSTNGQSAALQISAPNSDASANVYRVGTGLTADNEWVVYDVTNTQVVDKYIRGSSGFRAFYQNGSERMRLDTSGNLGIGTSSPGEKLQVVGNIQSKGSALSVTDVNGTNQWYINRENTTTGNLQFRSGATSLMELTPSGNLGLGVTPSGGTYPALEFGAPGIIRGNGDMNIASNAYYNAGWKYKNNGTATLFLQTSGQNQWYTAPSSTAGTAVTWTQAMTLTAAGVQLLGTTTSPSGSAPALVVQTTVGGGVQYAHGSGGGGVIYALSGGGLSLNTYTGAVGSETYTERARITSGGLMGLGMTPTGSYSLQIYGIGASTGSARIRLNNSATGTADADGGGIAMEGVDLVIQNSENGVCKWEINGSERARITSGGYFKASNDGTYISSTGSYHEFTQTQNLDTFIVRNTNASLTNAVFEASASRNTTDNSFYPINYYNSGASLYRFRVADSGNVTNTNGSYGTISDAKMKTDIVDAGSQWADIKAVRFRKFKMKDDPQQIVQLGVVAQELEQTSPGLVEEHADYEEVEITDEEGNVKKERQPTGTTTKSVKTSVLLMKAAVALQEAMARIEQLEAKVAALESKGV
jgi:hypothetical protein